MEKKEFNKLLDQMESDLSKQGLSRRDVLKLGTLGSALLMANSASAATTVEASSAKGKIVIIGGGSAGITVAAQLANSLSSPDITIVAPNDIHLYQPGQTLVAGGLLKEADLQDNNANYIPSGVKWVKAKVSEFDPDNNNVVTDSGEKIDYDFLVVATGLEYNYEAIDGLSKDIIGTNGIASIYLNDLDKGTCSGATKAWEQLQDFAKLAEKQKVNGLFSHPNTPIKCGGAPKKIMYLTEDYLRKQSETARANATLTFLPNGGKMFGVADYHDAIVKQFEARDMKWNYKHNLVKVDSEKKEATFAHTYKVKGDWDPDLEEYNEITKVDEIAMPFDFLHVTPPMKAPEVVKNSPLSWKKGSAAKGGWVELNKHTLQHTRFPNVFGLGDVAGIPMGKTGGSVRKQSPVVTQNIISAMEGKELTAKYEGYTVCPLITGFGTVMLAEFDYSKEPKPTLPLDPTVERWLWWVFKVYMLKPMYFHGMLRGRA